MEGGTREEPLKRVLIVEDYDVLADIESMLCTMEGYEVRVAHDADSAASAYGEFHPDLVMLDLGLPDDADGERFLDIIRGEGGVPAKVLVVSGRLDTATSAALESRDNVATMAKPFKLSELALRIQELLHS